MWRSQKVRAGIYWGRKQGAESSVRKGWSLGSGRQPSLTQVCLYRAPGLCSLLFPILFFLNSFFPSPITSPLCLVGCWPRELTKMSEVASQLQVRASLPLRAQLLNKNATSFLPSDHSPNLPLTPHSLIYSTAHRKLSEIPGTLF